MERKTFWGRRRARDGGWSTSRKTNVRRQWPASTDASSTRKAQPWPAATPNSIPALTTWPSSSPPGSDDLTIPPGVSRREDEQRWLSRPSFGTWHVGKSWPTLMRASHDESTTVFHSDAVRHQGHRRRIDDRLRSCLPGSYRSRGA